jgi:hypothetical protein
MGKFINSLCLKLGAEIGTNAQDRVRANEILRGLNEREFLKLLREESTLIVLMVRVANQERNELKKQQFEEREPHDPGRIFEWVN